MWCAFSVILNRSCYINARKQQYQTINVADLMYIYTYMWMSEKTKHVVVLRPHSFQKCPGFRKTSTAKHKHLLLLDESFDNCGVVVGRHNEFLEQLFMHSNLASKSPAKLDTHSLVPFGAGLSIQHVEI